MPKAAWTMPSPTPSPTTNMRNSALIALRVLAWTRASRRPGAALPASRIWAVGAAGAALHWDGAAWNSVESGSQKTLTGVWGSSANDVTVVGEAGTILKGP